MSTRFWPLALVPFFVLALVPTRLSAQVINEFVGNHTGPDLYEFVEIFGAPSTDYSHLTVVQIAGDAGSDSGVVESTYTVGSTDADGLWVSGFFTDDFDHDDTYSLFLVEGWSGTVGADFDGNDDGILDSTPWTSLVDSVGVSDGGGGDFNYLAEIIMVPMFDGADFSPGGASRFPNGTDTNSIGDWRRNDWDGAGLPGLTGFVDPNEVANTPGAINSTSSVPGQDPILHEFVTDHTGGDTFEFVEIWGSASSDYSAATVVALDKGGAVDQALPVGSTDAQGFWTSGFLADQFVDETLTLLLVDGWTGTVENDLDTNDDGTIDVTPWTEIYDAVAVRHGASDLTYATVVLEEGFGGQAGAVGGASRVPNFLDSDLTSDWLRNDFDGEGLGGLVGSLIEGEAANTPGRVNLPHVDTFYAAVDDVSAVTLRTTLNAAIDDHLRFPYSSGSTDTWDILELADEDPNDSGRILTVYKNSSEAKFGGGTGPYNREHTWPSSLGFPDQDDSYPYTDCHQLMLANPTYNSDRGSRAFGTCNAGCSERVTEVNNGTGGGTGVYPGNSNWLTGPDGGQGTWQAWGHRRGDVARGVLYLDVRYAGGVHGVTGLPEPDLVLTDDTSLIVGTGTNTTGMAFMGRLATLLAWHQDDPVDDEERLRNEVVYTFQGNRNPFVDHPEWVSCLFESIGCNAEMPLFADGFESGDTSAWALTSP